MSLRSRWNEGLLHLEVLQNADRAFLRTYAMQRGFRNANRPLWNTGGLFRSCNRCGSTRASKLAQYLHIVNSLMSPLKKLYQRLTQRAMILFPGVGYSVLSPFDQKMKFGNVPGNEFEPNLQRTRRQQYSY